MRLWLSTAYHLCLAGVWHYLFDRLASLYAIDSPGPCLERASLDEVGVDSLTGLQVGSLGGIRHVAQLGLVWVRYEAFELGKGFALQSAARE